ncbi:MAG: hypothetical protein ABIL18_05545 [candidate division WOR-3 bacterium]
MRKLLAVVIVAVILNGLYGLSLSLSGSYQDITDQKDDGAYFGLKADLIINLLPILRARGYLVEIDFSAGTPMKIGAFAGSDLLLVLPLPTVMQPYIVVGFSYERDSTLFFRGGFGAEIGFSGLIGYLEGNLNYIKPAQGNSKIPINIMGGIRYPLQIGF